MPNFQLHWLVAWQALDKIGGPALRGRGVYHTASITFRDRVYQLFNPLTDQPDVTKANVDAFFDVGVPFLKQFWRQNLYRKEVLEDVTCFSAFMLGACGPDIWMTPSISAPLTAGVHFDLGHYNRTHEQFRRSIEAIGDRTDAQAKLERSYFLGMATHIATDLVLHQLVNVSAGAYNLLKKDNWTNEHLPAPGNAKLFNAHNKVEHYWDSFIRYRYLGDLATVAPLFEPREGEWVQPLGFLLVETLRWKAQQWRLSAMRSPNPKRREAAEYFLDRLIGRYVGERHAAGDVIRPAARTLFEAPLLFPAMAADRILSEGPKAPPLDPFIYDRVVNKEIGAYPADQIFDEAIREAKNPLQMLDDRAHQWGKSECRKLRFFSTMRNLDLFPDAHRNPVGNTFNPLSLNYLNHEVCPDLDRLRQEANGVKYGEAFYEPLDVKRVGRRAVGVAKSFGSLLADAYRAKNPDALGDLGLFWNLDTGLGLEVQNVPSNTEKDIVTRLDFVHVLAKRIRNFDHGHEEGDLGFERPARSGGIPYLLPKKARDDDMTRVRIAAFPVRERIESTFPTLDEVKEDSSDPARFLDRIRIGQAAEHRLEDLGEAPQRAAACAPVGRWPGDELDEKGACIAWLDAFFSIPGSAPGPNKPFGTATQNMRREFAVQRVKQRLTLELRVPIPAIGEGKDEPALFFYCDRSLGIGQAATIAPCDWLANAQLIGYWPVDKAPRGGKHKVERRGKLRVFTARILVNFQKSDERFFDAGEWNNVVPYFENMKFYGRNFAVATGRRFVLYPTGSGTFNPTADFEYHSNVTPTEHVFLTVYPLLRTPWGVIDAFSDEPVDRFTFDSQIRKISGLEWKKVVLFYDLRGPDAVQLRRCFVDGLDVEVKEDPDSSEEPAPPAEPPAAAICAGKIQISDRIQFELEKDVLLPSAYPILDKVIEVLRNHPEVTLVEVQGHTCNLGAPAFNQDLSQRRANSVRTYLIGKGISGSRLQAKGYGQSSPVASNAAESDRVKNRRVEFKILQQ